MVKVGTIICTLDIHMTALHNFMLKVGMSKEATVEVAHSVPLIDCEWEPPQVPIAIITGSRLVAWQMLT